MRASPLDVISTISLTSHTSWQSRNWKRDLLSFAFYSGTLDRVDVLGDGVTGHTGCVNALSWAKEGSVLLSGGDDTTVCLWRMKTDNTEKEYPFVCDTVIHTGHHANIFNAQMLPHSSRIVTVAGDRQVRIFDYEKAAGHPGNHGETQYYDHQAAIRILRCHTRRVKRIVTEDSPDLFLTVAEDGSVRHHDLRVAHSCRLNHCPAPLVHLDHELSTLSLSPLTPYQFVVAGASPHGYLFDRRHAGRHFREEWGRPPTPGEVTTCVRRFGRTNRGSHERSGREHITGSRMATSNGHEVLLSYSSDAVYLYSTKDDPPPSSMATGESLILKPNSRRRTPERITPLSGDGDIEMRQERSERDALMDEDIERICDEGMPSPEDTENAEGEDRQDYEDVVEDDENEEEDEDEGEDEDEPASRFWSDERYGQVPTIMPRSRFAGACNVETVKDVNFLGPRDEFIVSGSDDGNWFMWEKNTGRLHNILEGDGSVVNVIEGHPYLPLVAVSGIDTTVKLFAPRPSPSRFSRLDKADAIIDRNAEASAARSDMSNLLLYYRIAQQMAGNGASVEGASQCPVQ
ncbi:WD40 repeat-like protein [Trametes meyenii]|nr:WD40 repeat-like protein [Trametes meyenii]